MKKQLSIIILFIVIPFAMFSQELEDDNFHFLDVGTGAGYTQSVHGAFNIALSNSMGSVMANFLDYNLYFGKSDMLFHEINFKIGPYYKINKYSYVTVSSGLSFMFNLSKSNWKDVNVRDSPLPVHTYDNDNYLINIPVQVKLNIAVYKNFCIGVKGTYNKMLTKSIEDKCTVLMYVSLGL